MENFVKISAEVVNNSIVLNSESADVNVGRSLVLVTKTGAKYVLTAKVRNANKVAIAKALAKASLVAYGETQKRNAKTAQKESKNRAYNTVGGVFNRCQYAYLTDKDGNIIATLNVADESEDTAMSLGKVFKFNTNKPLYKLVVEEGREWGDEEVVKALNLWVEAALDNLTLNATVDKKLGEAADSNEAEADAAEAASKKRKTSKKSEDVEQKAA